LPLENGNKVAFCYPKIGYTYLKPGGGEATVAYDRQAVGNQVGGAGVSYSVCESIRESGSQKNTSGHFLILEVAAYGSFL